MRYAAYAPVAIALVVALWSVVTFVHPCAAVRTEGDHVVITSVPVGSREWMSGLREGWVGISHAGVWHEFRRPD